jgi:hypothetical protein
MPYGNYNLILPESRAISTGLVSDYSRSTVKDRTYATIAKNLDLSNRQAAKNAKKT